MCYAKWMANFRLFNDALITLYFESEKTGEIYRMHKGTGGIYRMHKEIYRIHKKIYRTHKILSSF